jgi:hypothetical protein
MTTLSPEKLNEARQLALLIQHHQTIIDLLKAQQLKLIDAEDPTKDYELNLDTGEITDASDRGSTTSEV